jgi:hypothetical protein
MEQSVNEQPQMIYVQSSDGNKITLKPVTAQGGRQSESLSGSSFNKKNFSYTNSTSEHAVHFCR